MRVEWTVTPREQRRYLWALFASSLVKLAILALIGALAGALTSGDGIDWPATLTVVGLMLVVVGPLSYGLVRRSVARSYPVGSTASVEVDGADIRVTAAIGITEAPLARWQDPVVRGGGVRVKDSLSGRRCWFPRALFPDAVVALLGTGGDATAAQLPPLLDPAAPGQRTWTATREARTRLVRDRARVLVLRPSALLLWVLAVCILVVLPLVDGDGPNPLSYVLVAVIVAGVAFQVRSVATVTRRQYPDGFTAASSYAGGRLAVTTAAGTTEYAVAELTRPQVVGSVFSARVGRAYLALPAALVPPELLAPLS